MIEIVEALTKRQQKDFLSLPNDLFLGNPSYVPPLWPDEKKIFRKDYLYYETCEAVYYNAYKDGKMVGRISGILQKAANEKMNQKRVRFTRFDCIEDFEVAKALFEKVEGWAKSKGMDTVCGPLGFSDLEREGLLVDGFDEPETFEEQYNPPYYVDFIERLGYVKEVDWVESRVYAAEPEMEKQMSDLSDFVMKRYNLRFGPAKSSRDFIKRYIDGFFEILDKSYEGIYGTVPFTEGMKQLMKDNFTLLVDLDNAAVILDENDRVIMIALCLPSIAKAMQRSGGRLTPRAIFEILKAKRHPEIIDFALIGVDPAWLNRGVTSCIAARLSKRLRNTPGLKYGETNLNLENNAPILHLWKRFKHETVKRRRAYVKTLV